MESAMEDARAPAPSGLELVQDFVNTADLEQGTDVLAAPESCRDWLVAHDLLVKDVGLDVSDLEALRDVREAIRAVLRENNDGTLGAAALERLNRAAKDVSLRVMFDAGGAHLDPQAPGVGRAIGRLLAVIYQSMLLGTWTRLKVCRSDDCQWAFYDHSKNRSGAWCTMASCGNKTKTRAYRRRKSAIS